MKPTMKTCCNNEYKFRVGAMAGINVAFYLIHSMKGSSKKWERAACDFVIYV